MAMSFLNRLVLLSLILFIFQVQGGDKERKDFDRRYETDLEKLLDKEPDELVSIYRKTVDYLKKSRKLNDKELSYGEKLCSAILKTNDRSKREKYLKTLLKLRRKILFSHPDLNFKRLLINRCPPGKYSHNGDQHLARHGRVGPGMTILENWKSRDVKLKTLFENKLPAGTYRSPDIHFSGKKILFSYAPIVKGEDEKKRRYFIYEGALDGSWVRQVTGTKYDKLETWDDRATAIVEDTDPCYLPDETITFISTRSQTFGRCHGGRYNPSWVLYRCDKNGKIFKQLSYGNENEYDPSVLSDGRIVFSRWEYTSRHEMYFHMLWSTRPDGTGVANYFGNDMLFPMMITQQEQMPDSQKVVAVATGHHSYSTGTVIIIDTKLGENGEQAITRLTPETGYPETPGVDWPSPHYSHPYPINNELFLVSKAHHPIEKQGHTPRENNRGIYLIDIFGGQELIYEDSDVASFSPIPVLPKKRPRIITSVLPKTKSNYGTVYIQNIYETQNDPEGLIKPGSIKKVRVNALGIQPLARRTALHSNVSVEIPRKVLGTADVREDGSALFKVPAGVSIHLQALDKDGEAVLSEKSFWYVQPGEVRSCVGCHEKTGKAPSSSRMARRIREKPQKLTPPAGPRYAGGMSFARTVQPVLDRYCISCHGLDKKAGGVNLVHDGNVKPSGMKPLLDLGNHVLGDKGYMSRYGHINISRPYRDLAAASKLPEMLREGHGDVDIDLEAYLRIIEWLDMNAPIYGDLYPNKREERKFDEQAMKKLRAYIRSLFGAKLASQPARALVNLAQPQESRILMAPLHKKAGGWGQIKSSWTSKKHPQYRTMVSLIKACIVSDENENTRGWRPEAEMGASEDWVKRAREEHLKKSGAK